MKKKILIVIFFIVIFSAVLLFYPYNLYHYFTAEEKVKSVFIDSNMRERSFGDDSEILNVKYLGNYIYYVETDENTFLVEIKSSNSSHSIEIFEHNQHITQFKDY
ncbi:hypothetical protein ACFSTA_00260 [Ornithinibacillus salinisoli]|uniref:DUF3139 domain-containing protein n=1 Tax=Ornithinibacillus salinisoli TaxID=1848459 RepID=A0ABW4VU97_9BACI